MMNYLRLLENGLNQSSSETVRKQRETVANMEDLGRNSGKVKKQTAKACMEWTKPFLLYFQIPS